MDLFLSLARLLLAVIFTVAAVAKLSDLSGSRRAVIAFGVPPQLAGALGTLLPLTELAVAAALIPARTAAWGALGATALLLVFAAAIANNIAHGREADCHCFGQLRSSVARWPTLTRNLSLAAVAGLIAWSSFSRGVPALNGWTDDLRAAQLFPAATALAVLAVGTWLGVQFLRQHGRILLRLDALEAAAADGRSAATTGVQLPSADHALPVGADAPLFELPDPDGHSVGLRSLQATRSPVLLVFTHPDCGPCRTLLPDVGRWQREHAGRLTVALLNEASTTDSGRAQAQEHGLRHVLFQRDREVSRAYRVSGTPSAVLVDRESRIAAPVAAGESTIRKLVGMITDHALSPAAQLNPIEVSSNERAPH